MEGFVTGLWDWAPASSKGLDRIDLSTIDANTTAGGTQAFNVIGRVAHHGDGAHGDGAPYGSRTRLSSVKG